MKALTLEKIIPYTVGPHVSINNIHLLAVEIFVAVELVIFAVEIAVKVELVIFEQPGTENQSKIIRH